MQTKSHAKGIGAKLNLTLNRPQLTSAGQPTMGEREPADRTVTLYVGNRLDAAREIAPRQLAEQFIEAVSTGYFAEPCGRGGEWAFRLWLGGKDGFNSTWDTSDDDALIGALADVLDASDEKRTMVSRAVWGES